MGWGMKTLNEKHSDTEAKALAACYRLLLQKARERRARLAAENETQMNEQPAKTGNAETD